MYETISEATTSNKDLLNSSVLSALILKGVIAYGVSISVVVKTTDFHPATLQNTGRAPSPQKWAFFPYIFLINTLLKHHVCLRVTFNCWNSASQSNNFWIQVPQKYRVQVHPVPQTKKMIAITHYSRRNIYGPFVNVNFTLLKTAVSITLSGQNGAL